MLTKRILQKVRQDYSSIAAEFDVTRKHPWPEFTTCLKEIKKHFHGKHQITLLDVGCGNGRLFEFLQREPMSYNGIDNNRKLIALAKKNYPNAQFCIADILELPSPAQKFDTVWCVAVLHHLPTPALQLRALRQIKKVLASHGILVITVWNLWQEKYKKYIDVKTRSALVPWGSPPKAKRFYHAFQERELRTLLKRAGFSKIKKIKSARNLVYICSNEKD